MSKQKEIVVFREVKVGEYVLRFWPSDNGWMCGITSEMMQALTEQSAQQALDKKAENARELGLDYEPVPENFIDALKFDVAMREWVGLTPHERMMCRSYDIDTTIDKTEAKLKEKNT